MTNVLFVGIEGQIKQRLPVTGNRRQLLARLACLLGHPYQSLRNWCPAAAYIALTSSKASSALPP